MSNLYPNPYKGRWPLPNGRIPAPPPEEISTENPIITWERANNPNMASTTSSNPSTASSFTYPDRAVRETVPRAPAEYTPTHQGMGVFETSNNTQERYRGTERWGPTGAGFEQRWEERRPYVGEMGGRGSSVGGVAGAVAAAIRSGHIGRRGSAGQNSSSGGTFSSRLGAALQGSAQSAGRQGGSAGVAGSARARGSSRVGYGHRSGNTGGASSKDQGKKKQKY